jgi:hypothetical protein
MSRFQNKRLYTDVFPEFQTNLIGTEYAPLQLSPPPQPMSQPTIKAVKQRFGEAPTTKKTLMTSTPKAKTAETQTMTTAIVPSIYDEKKQEDIPKSQLDLPLSIALQSSYPEKLASVKDELTRYGYYIDPLSDLEHSVIVNPNKNKVIFGVRGTNVMNTNDILTDMSLGVFDIKTLNRYKKAQEKYKEIKNKFGDIPITHASHSLGGLISSQLAEPQDTVYSYNRPFLNYPIKKNEISISVETDPLLLSRLKGQKPTIIPRTYYEKAKDYVAIQKTKVNPDFETKPIEIPKEYKTDLPNTGYINFLKSIAPIGVTAKSLYEKYISRPEVYRQQLIQNLQEQAVASQQRMERVTARILPRARSTSPRTIQRLQQAISRPLTAIEQNVLNPTILDTSKRIARQIIRDPGTAFFDVLGHPLLAYAVTNYAGGYLTTRASNSHAIENLPLKIRIK